MSTKTTLKILFGCIFLSLAICTVWASAHQPVGQWSGLSDLPNRYWTIATFLDAYCGFLTFYAWVFYKEARWWPRIAWFVAIMLLGNMAMSAYVLLQLMRLGPTEEASALLMRRRG